MASRYCFAVAGRRSDCLFESNMAVASRPWLKRTILVDWLRSLVLHRVWFGSISARLGEGVWSHRRRRPGGAVDPDPGAALDSRRRHLPPSRQRTLVKARVGDLADDFADYRGILSDEI